MSVQPVEKTVDDQKYTFYRMRPKASLKLLVRIAKILAAPIGAAAGPIGKDFSIKSMVDNNISLQGMLDSLSKRLDEDEILDIVEKMLTNVRHGGTGEINKDNFDIHFEAHGGLSHMFKVFFIAIEVEYGDFFGGSLVKAKEIIGKVNTTQSQ